MGHHACPVKCDRMLSVHAYIYMKKKRIAIVAHGDIGWITKKELRNFSHVIGVDRAAYVLLQLGIIPNCAVGDFDSVSKGEWREIKRKIKDVREYPSDKDKTDLELAVETALKYQPEEIVIFGGTGGRLDHEIATLHLLHAILKNQCKGMIRDEHNEIRLVEGKKRVTKNSYFPYLSILPFTDEISVSIKGCKYPLQKYGMNKGTTLGVSNVITGVYADIVVHKGAALIFHSRDRE